MSEKLKITSGDKSMVLHVDLDLSRAVQNVTKCTEMLAEAQNRAMAECSPKNVEAYGQALHALCVGVFGEEQADRLIDFYEDNPEALIEDVMPYIFRRIVPKLRRESKRRAAMMSRAARK